MAEKWEEELGLANVRPLDRPMSAGPNDRWVGEDELGNKLYETPTGQRYSVRPASEEESKTTRAKVEDWVEEGASLPTWDQITESAKALPGAVYDSAAKAVRGEGTVGDVLGAATTLAAPGATKAFDAFDPTTTRMFFSAPRDIADKADKMLDSGFSEQEIAGRLGVWQDPKSLKWLAETDDSTFNITPFARVQAVVTSPTEIHNYRPLPIQQVISGTNILNDIPELQSYRAGVINPEILKRWGYDENVLGFHDRDFEQVFARRDEDRSTMLHEIQHAIDSVELRDAGANPQKVYHDLSQIVDNLPAEAKLWLNAKARLLEVEASIKDLEVSRKQALENKTEDSGTAWESLHDRRLEDITEYITGYKRQRNEIKASMKEVEAYDPDLYKSIKTLQDKLQTSLLNLQDQAHPIYEANEGETRARIVQARKDMKPEERYSTGNPLKTTENTWSQWDLTKSLNDIQNSLNQRNGVPDPWANVGFAKGGMVEQPSMDPVSKNPVPTGATPKEVRDDVPIMASEGEYVIPANVVRYLGLDKIEKLVNQAKKGLAELEQNGRIGGQTKDDLPFSPEELQVIEEMEGAQAPVPQMAEGGLVFDNNMDIDPETGLPRWLLAMQKKQAQPVATEAPKTPKTGSRVLSDNSGQQDSYTDRQALRQPLTGLAKPVQDWSVDEYEKYGTYRTSPEAAIMRAGTSVIPFGGVMSAVAQRTTERNATRNLEEMISSGKDLQGKPLSTAQLDKLKETYNRMGSEPISRIGGLSGAAVAIAKDAGLIKPRQPNAERVTRATERVRGDNIVNRAIDFVSKPRSAPEKSSSEKGVASFSKAEAKKKATASLPSNSGSERGSDRSPLAPTTSQRPKANPRR